MMLAAHKLRSTIRHHVRNCVLTVGGFLPLRRARFDVRFLYGHSISPAQIPAFSRTLAFLRQHYEFVSNEAAANLLREDAPPPGRYVAMSFDDGFRDNYEIIAPMLDEVGACACFFVVTNFIDCNESYRLQLVNERLRCSRDQIPMTWRMVRDLVSAGFEIGAHTTDHFDLSTLSPAEAERQILGSKDAIEAQCCRPCRLFAWPYGTLNHFPSSLMPAAERQFEAIFSAVRSASRATLNGCAINRDHFEPGWPVSHVRYFMRSRKTGTAVAPNHVGVRAINGAPT